MDDNNLLASVCTVVFKETENLEGKSIKIEGYDFNQGLNYSNLIRSMISTGFQAFNLRDAIEVVIQMGVDEVFLVFTSNLISSGFRDIIHYLVDVIVTTTGGIEDLIKCLAPTYKGDFRRFIGLC
ncbi:hypothetical protein IC582_019862 [Cucumis melo]